MQQTYEELHQALSNVLVAKAKFAAAVHVAKHASIKRQQSASAVSEKPVEISDESKACCVQ